TVTSAIAENPLVAPAIAGVILTSKSQGGIGTYGQFTLGTAAVVGNTGWLGYGRVDYRTGDNIEGWSVNAGLRYQFTPTRGGSVKDGPEPAVGTYNWTGPYIGALAGSTTGIEEWVSNAFGTTVNPRFAGYILGGEAGYNVQIGRAVLGVEGDYDF